MIIVRLGLKPNPLHTLVGVSIFHCATPSLKAIVHNIADTTPGHSTAVALLCLLPLTPLLPPSLPVPGGEPPPLLLTAPAARLAAAARCDNTALLPPSSHESTRNAGKELVVADDTGV